MKKPVTEDRRLFCFVRMKGLEPPRLTAPDPKSGSATNYDTSATGCKDSSFCLPQNLECFFVIGLLCNFRNLLAINHGPFFIYHHNST